MRAITACFDPRSPGTETKTLHRQARSRLWPVESQEPIATDSCVGASYLSRRLRLGLHFAWRDSERDPEPVPEP